MRQDPFLPRLRAIADMLMMPGTTVHDVYPRAGHDHIIYVFPRHDEWHVIIEPPVSTTRRGTDPHFAEDCAMRVECPTLHGACETAERVAETARRIGRSAMVIADGVYTAQVASSQVGGRA